MTHSLLGLPEDTRQPTEQHKVKLTGGRFWYKIQVKDALQSVRHTILPTLSLDFQHPTRPILCLNECIHSFI